MRLRRSLSSGNTTSASGFQPTALFSLLIGDLVSNYLSPLFHLYIAIAFILPSFAPDSNLSGPFSTRPPPFLVVFRNPPPTPSLPTVLRFHDLFSFRPVWPVRFRIFWINLRFFHKRLASFLLISLKISIKTAIGFFS